MLTGQVALIFFLTQHGKMRNKHLIRVSLVCIAVRK